MSDIAIRSELERLLTEAKAAARRGDKATARTLLTHLVERDPRNEQAWMWLSGVVSDPEEQQICLENVLVINPANDKARKGLEYLRTRTGSMPGAQHAPEAHPPVARNTAPALDMGAYAAGPPARPTMQPETGYSGHDYGYGQDHGRDEEQTDSLSGIFADWPSSPAPENPQFEAFPSEPFAVPPASGPFGRPDEGGDPAPYYPLEAHGAQWNQGDQFDRAGLAEAAGAIIDSWGNGSAGVPETASSDVWGGASGGWSAANAAGWDPGSPGWSAAGEEAGAQDWASPQASAAYQVPADPYAGFDMDRQGIAGQQYAPAPGAGQPGYADEPFNDLEPFSFDMSMNAEVESNTSTLYQGPTPAEQPYSGMQAGQNLQFTQQAQPLQAAPSTPPAPSAPSAPPSPAPASAPAGPPAWAVPDSSPYQADADQARGYEAGYEAVGGFEHGMPVPPAPDALARDPFAGAHTGGPVGPMGPMGPMGPYVANDLPAPTELPGYREPAAQPAESAQPWYLQIGEAPVAGYVPAGEGYTDGAAGGPVVEQPRKAVPTIPCPNCHEQVPETSLACPQCRYSFFVNCPHCHELVDTSEARPDNPEPCPYCGTTIDKMALGMAGVTGAIPYESVPLSKDGQQYPAMLSGTPEILAGRGLSFGWLVDLLWLAAIIAMVWALTQLPTWLNLPGQY
jgi:hypothetical protein